MPKRISKKKRDANETAAAVVALATADEPQIDRTTLSQVMSAMGRKGGKDRREAQPRNHVYEGT